MMIPDNFFMRRAFDLAINGLGEVSPNPCVGCVLVVDGKIIGEGWHRHYGAAHAEVNAVDEVADKQLLAKATAYVTLEPCSHFGKTPPCADMLIRHRVKKVIISNVDPNPLVQGSGIRKLRDAGIEVIVGLLEDQGRELNKRFFTFIEKERPFVILKWAQTADGFIARENFDSKWISNEYSRQYVHQWRAQEDAVLVGKRTAEHDDPLLSVRDWAGRNPVRVVIDRQLTLRSDLHLFDHSQKTICYNLCEDSALENLIRVKLSEEAFVSQLVQDLYSRKIQSVIVEGGKTTLDLFISSGIWDEARIFHNAQSFGSGIAAPVIRGALVFKKEILGDTLNIVRNG